MDVRAGGGGAEREVGLGYRVFSWVVVFFNRGGSHISIQAHLGYKIGLIFAT